MEQTYKNKQEATWSYQYTNKTNDGNKIYYRCNKSKKKGVQCPAGIHLLVHNKSEEVSLFRTEEEHDHQSLEESNKLSEKMKEEIKKLFDLNLNLKPKKIWDKLAEKGLKPKNKAQLSNYLVKLKQIEYGATKVSLGELESWCVKNNSIPESDDGPYVAVI